MATRMQQRRGTASQWISTNSGNGPILSIGEIGFESDTNKFKIGDGVNHWVDLTYFTDSEAALAAVSALIDGAPSTLDTLNELAAAINDDPAFFTTIATNLSNHQSDTTSIHGIADTAELATKAFTASLLTSATKTNIAITGDKNGLTITAENGVADSTTDNLTEGSTNKYFTDERAQDAVGNAVGHGLKYTDSTGAIEPDLAVSGGLYIEPGNKLAVDGYYVTFNGAEQNLTNKTLTSPKINENVAVTATATEINVLDGITASTAELNILDGVTATAAELNTLDGITASVTELNILDGATASAAELNILDGATLSTTELNYVDGVTSAIQTQLDSKAPLASPTFTGTVNAAALTLSGNLTVNGTTTTVSSTNLEITDPLIYIGTGNSANANDLGIVGHFDDGTYQHTGLARDASDSKWKLFSGVTTEPSGTIDFTTYTKDTLVIGALEATSATIGNVSNTELQYLDGVTSAIQTQLDAKLSSSTASSTYAPLVSPTFTGTVVLPSGTVTSSMIANGTIVDDDISSSAAIAASKLAPSGTNGQLLTTVAGVTSWADAPISLPSQTGNNGKYLTTDGSTASWGTVSSYSAPTLGSTSIASGATVTDIAGLTINSTTIPSSKTLVVTTDKLSALAATSSSELAGVISDETGTGALVFGTAPAISDPKISILRNTQTGTTYTLVLTDAGKLVTLNNASAITLTVPTNASVAFPIGTQIMLAAFGAGRVTLTSSATIRSGCGLITRAQYSGAVLTKIDTDEWLLVGDTAVL